jgi:alpha-beta hydrolase superfamily lysophospholipase
VGDPFCAGCGHHHFDDFDEQENQLNKEERMSKESFSFSEVQSAGSIDLPAPETLTASDGVKLVYRKYIPQNPRAVLLFHHGGGAHSGAGYQHLGNGLQTQFDVAVYMPDLRGHGASGGARGDAPSPKQVWADVTTFIKQIRAEFPGLPFILGGHSSGGGLILNYASQPEHETVDRYLFVSPELGFRSNTARPNRTDFAAVTTFPFIVNAMSGGALLGHSHAVRFNYPKELLAADKGMVASYSVNMANAVTPSAPHQQFKNLDRPFGLWIGADDELLLPGMVLAFADLAATVRASSETGSIPNANHLSVLLNAHATVGPWIANFVQGKNPQG